MRIHSLLVIAILVFLVSLVSWSIPHFRSNDRVERIKAALPSLSRYELGGSSYFQLSPVWSTRLQRQVRWPDGSSSITTYPTTYLPGMTGDWWIDVVDGTWEPATFRVLRTLLSMKHGVFIDFGSWIGPTALYAAQYATRVIAMDPDPWAFEMLMANFKANPILAAKADVYFLCISQQRQNIKMHGEFPGRGGSGSSAIFDKFSGIAEWTAPCMPLGELLEAEGVVSGDISAIKIDTEGAELTLFPALVPTLRSLGFPPIWFSIHHQFWVEVSPNILESKKAALLAAMEQYKYWYDEELRPAARHVDHYVVLLSSTPITLR